MLHVVGYNKQRDNVNFHGKFSGYAQCFSTSVWMAMSFYCSQIDAVDDIALSKYVDDVEASVGNKPGLAEDLRTGNVSLKGRTSLFWVVQKAGMQKWLSARKVAGRAGVNLRAPFSMLIDLLDSGPVVVGTNKMGGLKGGHIVLAIGYDDDAVICNDPFGDATTNYEDRNGDSVRYSRSFLEKYFRQRVLYWKV